VRFRVGIDVGDVIADQTDLHGNGVIVAVRLQTVCPVGGVCVSRSVRDHVRDRLDLSFEELGELSLKNISRPVEAFALCLDAGAPALERGEPQQQDIGYCRTRDGVRLAWARSGQGPPLVKAGNWLNHLEYDWESPIWRHLFRRLSREHTLIRYDPRGNGMSDWDVNELSLDAWVNDLETVVDAAGVERFPLLGISQGSAISVAYAVRHPERVSRLILYGGFAVGRRKRNPTDKDQHNAMLTLMRLGWGMDNPNFRQMFTGIFIPGATHEQANIFNELQRRTTSPECAARYFDVVGDLDITDLLAEVKAPTLVMHLRGDLITPFEAGRRLAAGIPGAQFVALQGQRNMSRPPTDSSKRSSCFSANEVTLRPISSRPLSDSPAPRVRCPTKGALRDTRPLDSHGRASADLTESVGHWCLETVAGRAQMRESIPGMPAPQGDINRVVMKERNDDGRKPHHDVVD
jgi:pimeloyl-ACP methyl ester carboxylesterase